MPVGTMGLPGFNPSDSLEPSSYPPFSFDNSDCMALQGHSEFPGDLVSETISRVKRAYGYHLAVSALDKRAAEASRDIRWVIFRLERQEEEITVRQESVGPPLESPKTDTQTTLHNRMPCRPLISQPQLFDKYHKE